MSERRVKGLWWEGSNLKIVTEDEKLLTFTNCYRIFTPSDGVTYDESTGIGEVRFKFTFDFQK